MQPTKDLKMKLDDLTIGEAKKLVSLFGSNVNPATSESLNDMIGEKVIIRTYTAGNFFGTLEQKSGSEVILKDARRLWYWKAAESIALSAVALYGIDQKVSKICPAVDKIWLEAIEIIPCTKVAIKSIEGAPDAKVS